MKYISVDVESDGPAPGENLYSMVSLGAVVVEPRLDRSFYAEMKPISENYSSEALDVNGFTRQQTMGFIEPSIIIPQFAMWLNKIKDSDHEHRIRFISDNNGYDWMFVCWYLHRFYGSCPFGWSSSNINDLFKGLNTDHYTSFKHLRTVKHTHNALDDAMGNAGALLKIFAMMKERNGNS